MWSDNTYIYLCKNHDVQVCLSIIHHAWSPLPKAELLPQDLFPFEIQIPEAISPVQELPYGEQTSFGLAALSLYSWT